MIKFYSSTSITIAALTSLVLMILLWKGCGSPALPAQQLVTSTTVEKVTSSQSEAQKPNEAGTEASTNSAAGLLGSSVLLATSQVENYTLRPVDPRTGQDLSDYEPISLGQHFKHAFSPDGQTLALVVSPWDWPRGSILHLVDLRSWRDVATEVKIDAWVNTMAFSPDGTQLAIASDYEGSLSLTLVDVAKQTVTAKTSLNFIPRLLEYTPDGAALLSYGSDYQHNDPQAQVALFNSANLSVTWQQALPEVKEGFYPTETKSGPASMIQFEAGAVFSPERHNLYIVHADEEKLTTVDFVEQAIHTVEISSAQAWLDTLMSLTADVAQAKTLNGTKKEALFGLSDKGLRLYVVGRTIEGVPSEELTETPLGLQVIDPANGQEIARFDTEATQISLSPDKTQLYLHSWLRTESHWGVPWMEILDADRLEVVARLDEQNLIPARRLDGQTILLSSYTQPDEDQTNLAVLDAESFEVIQNWSVKGYGEWLTELACAPNFDEMSRC